MVEIKVNDKFGNEIGRCELSKDELGNFYLVDKKGVRKVFTDVKQGTNGFDDVIDIDLNFDGDNIISPKKLKTIKELTTAWTTFQVMRTEYNLGASEDNQYGITIIGIPYIHKMITREEYKSYIQALRDFLGFDGKTYENDTYDYKELDELIRNLNPIYDI